MGTAAGSFQLSSWNEEPYYEGHGSKMTLAAVTQSFSGDIKGDGSVRWLMAYREDGTARFVGMQRVEGSLAGRDGSFVLETRVTSTGRWPAGPQPSSPDQARRS